MNISLLFLSLTLTTPGQAQTSSEVSYMLTTDSLPTHSASVTRAMTSIGVTARTATCDPRQADCVAQLLAGTGNTRLIVARAVNTRGACSPIRNAAGEVTGRRMPAPRPTLSLELYDRDGHVIARSYLDLTMAERGAIEAQIRELISR